MRRIECSKLQITENETQKEKKEGWMKDTRVSELTNPTKTPFEIDPFRERERERE
jgi:hypothetical protein